MGPVVAVAEASARHVELGRRHAEVEQRAGQFVDVVIAHHVADPVEAAVRGGHAIPEALEAFARGRQRLLVAVDAQHGQRGILVEQRGGVPSATECRVEHGSRRDGGEHGHDLVDHHRLVDPALSGGVIGVHRSPRAISALPRSATSA